jgi:hypothetical protein
MTEIVKVDPKDFGLEEKNVKQIEEAFLPKVAEREGLMKVYEGIINKEITKETCNEARECRLKLVKVRTGIASIHKTQKAFFLASGKFVDAWKNKETEPVNQMEENLMQIEKHFEIQEQKRLEALQKSREEMLEGYVEDPTELNLSGMEEDVWEAYFSRKKQDYRDRLLAEKEAEEKRKKEEEAEKARLKAIEEENARLKAEAEEKERVAAEERKRQQEKERKLREENERKLREERELREKAEAEERAKREKLEKELRDKEDAEKKAKEEEEARKQAELNKGDEAKVQDLVRDLESLKTKYSFESDSNKEMYEQVGILLTKVVNYINS